VVFSALFDVRRVSFPGGDLVGFLVGFLPCSVVAREPFLVRRERPRIGLAWWFERDSLFTEIVLDECKQELLFLLAFDIFEELECVEEARIRGFLVSTEDVAVEFF
jgi:hypothetical protein